MTEVRVVFRETPWLGLAPRGTPRPPANELVLRIGPKPGARLRLQAKAAEGLALRPIDLDMEFAAMGGEGPTAYEVLLEAALRGESFHFARQDVGRGDVARRAAADRRAAAGRGVRARHLGAEDRRRSDPRPRRLERPVAAVTRRKLTPWMIGVGGASRALPPPRGDPGALGREWGQDAGRE